MILCLRRHSSKHSEVLFSYHPCDNVRLIWLWQYPVQFGREIGAWLFVFGQASTSLNMAREIAVGVVDMMWSMTLACCRRGVRERIRLHGRVAGENKPRWSARTSILTHNSVGRTMTKDYDLSWCVLGDALFLVRGGLVYLHSTQVGLTVGWHVLSMRNKNKNVNSKLLVGRRSHDEK